jgi:hypothetical protein
LDIFNVSVHQQLDQRMKQAVNDWRQGLSNRRFHQACYSELAGKDEHVHIWRHYKMHCIVTKTTERQPIIMDDQVEKELPEWDAAMATKVSEGVRNDADDDQATTGRVGHRFRCPKGRQIESFTRLLSSTTQTFCSVLQAIPNRQSVISLVFYE